MFHTIAQKQECFKHETHYFMNKFKPVSLVIQTVNRLLENRVFAKAEAGTIILLVFLPINFAKES